MLLKWNKAFYELLDLVRTHFNLTDFNDSSKTFRAFHDVDTWQKSSTFQNIPQFVI